MTFEAISDLFASNDLDRIRPYRPGQVAAYDFVRQARDQGPSHRAGVPRARHQQDEHAPAPCSRMWSAFANTNGGTIYIGVGPG